MTFDIWFSFDGILEPEDWAQKSDWLHQRPTLRRSMHWRSPQEFDPQIHHPLTFLRCDAYAQSDAEKYDSLLGPQGDGGSKDSNVAPVSSRDLDSCGACAKGLFKSISVFIRQFGRPQNESPMSPRDVDQHHTRVDRQREQLLLKVLGGKVQEMLQLGLSIPRLRDEIYVHILKEINIPVADTTSGSSYVSSGQKLYDQRCIIAGLGLLCLTISVFLPSQRFLPYLYEFVRRFRHAILMQCAPFRVRALCLLTTTVLFGQLVTSPSLIQVQHVLIDFNSWMCDVLNQKDLSEAFGSEQTFRLFYFDGPRENFSARDLQTVGTVPVC